MNNLFAPNPSDVPQGDPAGQAVASLKGYAYQLYASALAWLDLGDGEVLYLEVAQDYATAAKAALAAVQVKDTRAKVTINSSTVRKAINDFVDLVKRNPRRQVTLRFLTTSNVGTEKKVIYRAAGEPTLKYWCKAGDDADITPLRNVLERLDLSDLAKAYIKERTDEQLRNDLIKRITWDCGAQDFGTLKEQLEEEVVIFANKRLSVPPSEGRRAAATVLQHVLHQTLEAKPSCRKLTPASLLDAVAKATGLWLPRAGLETHVTALVSEALHSVGKPVLDITPHPQIDIARDALERDFLSRYRQAQQRSFFPEVKKQDQFQTLARQILDGNLVVLSDELRRRILLRAVRSAALKKDLPAAESYMTAAAALKGPDTDLPARARLAEARGEIDTAIQILRDGVDPDSRSTLLSIIARQRGNDAALAWLEEQNLNVYDLTDNGIITLCNFHLVMENCTRVKDILESLDEKQIEDCPYFLFFRSVVRFASILAKPEQHLALMGMQLDIRRVRPVTPDAETAVVLNSAIQDARRLVLALMELGLQETISIAEDYIFWFELLHPELSKAALTQLASDMQKPATALKRIHFALAYLPDFDPALILKHLENRVAFGGLNEDELRAGLTILMHNHENTAPLAAFIAQHREKLDATFGKLPIRQIEIQALARAGDASGARTILNANNDEINPEEIVCLNAMISMAEGADPVTEFKRAYDETGTTETLRNLIGILTERNDHRSIGPYCEELFARTHDPMDLAFAARSYARAGDNDSFLRIAETNKAVLERDSELRRHYAWQLLSRGQLTEALVQANRLAETATTRDLDLEIAISIDSGDWEALAQPLRAYLQSAPNVPAIALVRAAHLAQAAGQGPLKELVEAAVARGSDDPNVLLGAYMVYVEEGLEDIKDEVRQWFRRALDLSGPDGPIRQFELKDILEKQTEWIEFTRRIQDGIARGNIPLVVAITGLRTTLVDLFLRNFTRNIGLTDARRKVAIPLYSGRRRPASFGEVKRLALDFTALLVLGWLGILPKVLETFNELVLPSGIFRDLFEGRRRIRELQKSRLRRAERIQQSIASERIKIVRTSFARLDPMVAEVGEELAGLLRVAESTNGIVLRPAPVHKPGILNQDADVSLYTHRLADTHSLLRFLQDEGLTDQPTEEVATRYFALQDRGWPEAVCPDPSRPLFIDGLGLIYLDSVRLLDMVLAAFPQVFIHSSTADEVAALIEHDNRTLEVLQVIDGIRESVRKAQSAGKIVYGPHHSRKPNGDDDDGGDKAFESSTINLMANLVQADVAVIDDRGINKEPFVLDNHGHRARVVTSLDMIEELCRRKIVSTDERRVLRHKLRCAGATLVPLDKEEIVFAALRSRGADSAEFRAMRESILLARVANLPRFPSEIPWLATTAITIKSAIMEVWVREPNHNRAAALADAIRELQTHPEDWVDQWDGQVPPGWVNAVNHVLVAGLALPVELQEEGLIQAYNRWVESSVLEPLRSRAPESYAAVVEYIRTIINSIAEGQQ